MKVQRIESGGRRGFLADVELTEANQRILDEAMAEAGGAPTWRSRKHAEARDLLALSQRAERFDVLGLDMRETLRVMAGMAVTVPCLEAPDAELIVEKQAVLGIRYFEEAIRLPQPGYRFVQILAPHRVWHANVSRDPAQALCLGVTLPAGIPVTEIVIMTYAALTMQTFQVDEYDGAGLLNRDAGRIFQQRMKLLPLSKAPFLSPRDGTQR